MSVASQRGAPVIYVAGSARELPPEVQDWLGRADTRAVASPHIYDMLAQLARDKKFTAIIVNIGSVDWAEMEFFDHARRLSRNTPIYVTGPVQQRAKLEAACRRGARPFDALSLEQQCRPIVDLPANPQQTESWFGPHTAPVSLAVEPDDEQDDEQETAQGTWEPNVPTEHVGLTESGEDQAWPEPSTLPTTDSQPDVEADEIFAQTDAACLDESRTQEFGADQSGVDAIRADEPAAGFSPNDNAQAVQPREGLPGDRPQSEASVPSEYSTGSPSPHQPGVEPVAWMRADEAGASAGEAPSTHELRCPDGRAPGSPARSQETTPWPAVRLARLDRTEFDDTDAATPSEPRDVPVVFPWSPPGVNRPRRTPPGAVAPPTAEAGPSIPPAGGFSAAPESPFKSVRLTAEEIAALMGPVARPPAPEAHP